MPRPRGRPLKDPTPAKLGAKADSAGRGSAHPHWRRATPAALGSQLPISGASLGCSAPSLRPPPHRGYAPLQLMGNQSLLMGGAGGLCNRAELKVTSRPFFPVCMASVHRPGSPSGLGPGGLGVRARRKITEPSRLGDHKGVAKSPEVQPARKGSPGPHPGDGAAPAPPGPHLSRCLQTPSRAAEPACARCSRSPRPLSRREAARAVGACARDAGGGGLPRPVSVATRLYPAHPAGAEPTKAYFLPATQLWRGPELHPGVSGLVEASKQSWAAPWGKSAQWPATECQVGVQVSEEGHLWVSL